MWKENTRSIWSQVWVVSPRWWCSDAKTDDDQGDRWMPEAGPRTAEGQSLQGAGDGISPEVKARRNNEAASSKAGAPPGGYIFLGHTEP